MQLKIYETCSYKTYKIINHRGRDGFTHSIFKFTKSKQSRNFLYNNSWILINLPILIHIWEFIIIRHIFRMLHFMLNKDVFVKFIKRRKDLKLSKACSYNCYVVWKNIMHNTATHFLNKYFKYILFEIKHFQI